MSALHLTGDRDADDLLATDSFALMVVMLLDQQVTMESAFAEPKKLVDRLEEFSPAAVAALAPEILLAAFREQPVVHRFAGSTATRVQSLAQMLVADYDGSAEAVWTRSNEDGSHPPAARSCVDSRRCRVSANRR